MKKYYRWRLQVGSSSPVVINPVWGDDANQLASLTSGQMYHRTKVNAGLFFSGTDFNLIFNADFETEFRLQLQYQQPNNSFTTERVVKFYKSDLTEHTEKRQFVLNNSETFDLYDQFEQGLNKEFNLPDLSPVTTPVNYQRLAILQVYLPGSNLMANFRDGYFFETPVTSFNTTPDGDGISPESPIPGGSGVEFNDVLMTDYYGFGYGTGDLFTPCLLYTSDAADE